MKKPGILIVCCLFLLQQISFGQTVDPVERTDALKKSDRLKKTANAFIISGGAILITGFILNVTHADISPIQFGEPEKSKTAGLETACGITGTGLMLASIPLFSAARRQKQKAMQLTMGKTQLLQIGNRSFVYRNIPSLKITLNL